MDTAYSDPGLAYQGIDHSDAEPHKAEQAFEVHQTLQECMQKMLPNPSA